MAKDPVAQLAECRAKARIWTVVVWQKCVGIILYINYLFHYLWIIHLLLFYLVDMDIYYIFIYLIFFIYFILLLIYHLFIY